MRRIYKVGFDVSHAELLKSIKKSHDKIQNSAILFKIKANVLTPSGAPDNADYGPTGAFRSGTHLMLCQRYFDYRDLAKILTPKAGTKLDDQINKASVMLHELFHVYNPTIKGL